MESVLEDLEAELDEAQATNRGLSAEAENAREGMKALQISLDEAKARCADLEEALATANAGGSGDAPAPSPRVDQHNKQRIATLEAIDPNPNNP